MRVCKPFFIITIILLFTSCANINKNHIRKNFEMQFSTSMNKNITPAYVYFENEFPENSNKNHLKSNSNKRKYLTEDKRGILVDYALKFNNKKSVIANEKFRNDCSGFVRSIYYRFNLELFNTEKVKKAGKWLPGTEVIYNFIKENGKIFKNSLPRRGDLIFFDNTHDRNKDGKVNDKFTHVAIVVDVKSDGTVYYIHKSNRGINIQKMNLNYPNKVYIYKNGKKIKVNSYLRKKRKNDSKNTPYLSSQMFRAYGSLFKSLNLAKNR